MKNKNYEKNRGIYFLSILLMGIEGLLFYVLTNQKMEEYQKGTAIVEKDHYITVVVTKEERKLFYRNKKMNLKGKTFSYQIEEDYGKIMESQKKEYYQLLLLVQGKQKAKPKDVVEYTIHKRNKRLIEILKIIWEGD